MREFAVGGYDVPPLPQPIVCLLSRSMSMGFSALGVSIQADYSCFGSVRNRIGASRDRSVRIGRLSRRELNSAPGANRFEHFDPATAGQTLLRSLREPAAVCSGTSSASTRNERVCAIRSKSGRPALSRQSGRPLHRTNLTNSFRRIEATKARFLPPAPQILRCVIERLPAMARQLDRSRTSGRCANIKNRPSSECYGAT